MRKLFTLFVCLLLVFFVMETGCGGGKKKVAKDGRKKRSRRSSRYSSRYGSQPGQPAAGIPALPGQGSVTPPTTAPAAAVARTTDAMVASSGMSRETFELDKNTSILYRNSFKGYQKLMDQKSSTGEMNQALKQQTMKELQAVKDNCVKLLRAMKNAGKKGGARISKQNIEEMARDAGHMLQGLRWE